jgi:hypothetical protein
MTRREMLGETKNRRFIFDRVEREISFTKKTYKDR